MIDALDRCGISFDCHIYAYGPHGYSTADASVLTPNTDICGRAGDWVEDSLAWLKDLLGSFGGEKMTEPHCPRRINDDGGEFLSVDCTLGYLMGQEAAKTILNPIIKDMMEQQGGEQKEILGFIKNMKLRDII